ncbi:hypothetical protein BKA67DRAFT_174333 [Truncatella angustata]|uniref:Uncharacterized protein n=1 Tax=Truncatella angustata TaxID=152316 RepID=A0A9P8URC6_9PEZI|nr:uncharacterized protein BKA67DRAFT_174333 [Truncatella angustata]KAH6656906.1 hypothetical protein BKA67DRAFT_174333 [Truncatella angustata]
MVSIFGLRIGGDKKKKSGQPNSKLPQQQTQTVTQTVYQGALDASKVSLDNGNQPGLCHDNTRPTPQTGISKPDLLVPNAHLLQAFYSPGSQALASASMQDLTRTTPSGDSGFHALKPAISNPNFGVRWNNGSTPNLTTTSPETTSQSLGTGKPRPWVDPLDVHFAREQHLAPSAKSLLNQSHQDEEKPAVLNAIRDSALPMGLNINKLATPAIPPRSALRNPPSPPPSVKTASEKASSETDRLPVWERPIIPAAAGESRPSSRGSQRNVPTSLRELMAVEDFALYESASVPTPPPSLPRASNETGNRASMNEWGEPVIQNVRAKRETLTISPARKQSLERLIDSFDRRTALNEDRRPRTSSGARPIRPKPLTLDTGLRSADGNGPNSAPFGPIQRTASPSPLSPRRVPRTGVPAAAVGARGRPTRPSTRGVPRPSADEYGVAAERPLDDVSNQDFSSGRPIPPPLISPVGRFQYGSPPDNPIMPLDGPLANSEHLESPPGSPVSLISPITRFELESPPDSPIMPLNGPLANTEHLESPPDSPIMPLDRPMANSERFESPPDSPIMPLDGPLANSENLESPPDSPIMPSNGPLASSMYLPVEPTRGSPGRNQLDTNFRFPDWSKSSGSWSDPEASTTRPPPLDNPPLAETVNWPLNAPVVDAPIFPTPDSPSLPLRSQSPFAIPSFSRPWTPTNARPGTPVKMTELTVPSGLRGSSPSPRRGVPPPRRVPEYASRSPLVARDHTGAGFL